MHKKKKIPNTNNMSDSQCNYIKQWRQILARYLPDYNMPRWLLQQGPVGSDGGKQCLPCAFSHSRPWVNTQLAQLGVQAQPQAVKGRGRVERPVKSLPFFLGLLLQSFLLPLQLLCDGFASLEEVVWNIPLWVNTETGIESVGIYWSWKFCTLLL